MEKKCQCCEQIKPTSDYYKHPKTSDGFLGKCKECQKANTKKNRELRPDYYREYDNKRANLPHRVKARAEYSKTDQGKDRHRAANEVWMDKHPNRRAASHILNNGIRDGKVQRHPCFVCGAKAHAHHPDYDRPLDVIWLCPKHHRKAHQLTKE